MTQEYEQHLIGIGVKTGTKKSVSTHTKRRRAGEAINVNTPNKGYSINPCWHLSTCCNSPFFPTHKVVAEEVEAVAEDAVSEKTQSSSNLLNDTQQSLLASPQPGLKPKTFSDSLWGYPQVCAWLNGKKSLIASTLLQREKTLCIQLLQERKKTPCVQALQEREKTPCVQSLQEREKNPCIQSQSVFIPDQCFRLSHQPTLKVEPVGCRLRHFLSEWENQKAHQSILSLIQDRYKLPFRERPKLSRFPCTISGYTGSDN